MECLYCEDLIFTFVIVSKVYGDAGDDSIGFAEHGALQEWFGGRAMTPSDLGPSSPRI